LFGIDVRFEQLAVGRQSRNIERGKEGSQSGPKRRDATRGRKRNTLLHLRTGDLLELNNQKFLFDRKNRGKWDQEEKEWKKISRGGVWS